MRKVVIGFMALLLSSGLGFAQSEKGKAKGKMQHPAAASNQAGVKDAIKKMEDELREGTLKGDPTAMEKYMADDGHAIGGANGQAYGKSDLVDRLKSGKTKYSQITVSDNAIEMYGPNLAISHGMADVKLTMDGKDVSGKYHFARTWHNHGGKWQFVWFQSTKVQ